MEHAEIMYKLEKGIESINYAPLDAEDVEYLIIIYECKGDKQTIFSSLFKGYDFKTTFGTKVWQRINTLEAYDLIYLERSEKSIVKFWFHPNLKYTLMDLYPQFFIKESDRAVIFEFTLFRNCEKEFHAFSDYSGFFELNKDIILKKGSIFEYTGTIKDDYSISITIVGEKYRFDVREKELDININYDDVPF